MANTRLAVLEVTLLGAMTVAQERRPALLQIFRERVKAGGEAEYSGIEEYRARVCAELQCPHPHVALATVSTTLEVWWLNAFESDSDRQRVEDAYARNSALTEALGRDSKRKAALTGSGANTYAKYREDVSEPGVWPPIGASFWVVVVTRREPSTKGAVFEDADGTRFVFVPAASQRHAESEAARLGPEAKILAVRPQWGMPAQAWVAADPAFWALSPVSRRK